MGIHDSTEKLLAAVQGYVDDGYVRIKLKIEPGSDIEQVGAVRGLIGPDTPFQVDANTAYRRTDGAHLARLDEFDLLLIEQPLPEDDIVGHARLAAEVETPICLDESLVSAAGTADAIELGACEIANIKPGRVGGYLEAVRIHDLCVAKGVPVWCGGMLETGIGRAANAALAALPGFTLARRHQRIDSLLRAGHRDRPDHDHRRPRHRADEPGTRIRPRPRVSSTR